MREAKFKKPITISVQVDLYERVKKITDEQKISIAEWFRRVAENELQRLDRKETSL